MARLVAAEAKGLVTMPSPLTSGAAVIRIAALTADPEFGWSYFEQLAANGVVPQGGNGAIFTAVAPGREAVRHGHRLSADPRGGKGLAGDVRVPAEGVSAVTEPVAIFSTTSNPEAAKAFVDFLLSEEGQELAASQGDPAALPAVAPPPGFPPRDEIVLMDFDPAAALANEKADKDRFVELFGE